MATPLMDGWTALTMGLIAGGCRLARVTVALRSEEFTGTLVARLPAAGGRVQTLEGPEAAGAPEAPEGMPDGPVLWACTGQEAPELLRRVEEAGSGPSSRDRPARLVIMSMPPAPGLQAITRLPGLRYIWAPGSSRMAYRLAAAACGEAAAGAGPCYLLIDGELPPETVAVGKAPAPGARPITEPTQTWPEQTAEPPACRAADLPPFHYVGPERPEILLVGTGTAFGELARAQAELVPLGRQVGHLHLRQLRPLPVAAATALWTAAGKVVLQEPPGGGLAAYLRDELPGYRDREPVVVANLDQLADTLGAINQALR